MMAKTKPYDFRDRIADHPALNPYHTKFDDFATRVDFFTNCTLHDIDDFIFVVQIAPQEKERVLHPSPWEELYSDDDRARYLAEFDMNAGIYGVDNNKIIHFLPLIHFCIYAKRFDLAFHLATKQSDTIHAKDGYNQTIAHVMAKMGIAIDDITDHNFKTLYQKNIRIFINSKDSDGNYPMHSALLCKQPVKQWLSFSKQNNEHNIHGLTPLDIACLYGLLEEISLLLYHGALLSESTFYTYN